MTSHKRLKRLVRARAAMTGEPYTAALRHFPPRTREQRMTGTQVGLSLCSFCGRSSDEVEKLLAGPGVYICDKCVSWSSKVLTGEFDTSKLPPPTSAPNEDALAWLPGVAQTIRNAERDLKLKVDLLRSRGVAWKPIAEALDISESDAVAAFGDDAAWDERPQVQFWWRTPE